MKANRNSILRDEDAVSPVIAVILMVAITVVLAATVFVLVSDIGQNAGTPATNVGFDASETDDNMTVTSAPNADWQKLQYRSTVGDVWARLNTANITGQGGSADTWYDISSASDLVEPSDYLHFCTYGTAVTNVKISIQDKDAKSLLGTFDFSSIGTNC